MKTLRRHGLVASLTLAALSACGGGGGGDPVVEAAPAAGNPGTPTGTGGTDGTGTTAVNPGLAGWFAFRPAATNTVFRVDPATGNSTLLATAASGQHSLILSPDGSRYAQVINDSVTGQENSEFMKLQVYETATKRLLLDLQFDGYANTFQFSPDNRFLAAIRYPDLVAANTLTESGLAIIDMADLANPVVVVDFMASGNNVVYDYDWLPGNGFVYLRGDRTLWRGSALVAGGNAARLGALEVPPDHFVSRDISASPDGTRILLSYNWKESSLTLNDIWVANIDGSGAARFSDGQHGDLPAWSPDGRYVFMRTNAGAYAQAGASTAYCKRWYAPATARNVSETGAEAQRVRYLENGRVVEMPCFSSVTYMRQ